MHKDSPFDLEYTFATYVLQRAEDQGVVVVNRPQGLRDANEKVFTAWLLDCLDLEIPVRDTQLEAGAREDLIEIGGKGQVPCLVIEGEPLYESADVVQRLQENAG